MQISAEKAAAAYEILVEVVGAEPMDRHDFVHHVATKPKPSVEYRLNSRLGFGGKFRNNGNRPTPYVDCYEEDRNAERDALMTRANEALANLFR